MLNITKISSFMDDFLVAKHRNFRRLGILSVDGVLDVMKEIDSLPHSSKRSVEMEAFSQLITVHNVKLRTFLIHGTKCRCCGIEGAFFAVEINEAEPVKSVLMNLYAINEDGEEVLMNADHRLPKYHGGANSVDNMQTMCQPCNLAKGHKLIFTDGGVKKPPMSKSQIRKAKMRAKSRKEAKATKKKEAKEAKKVL